MPIQLQQRMPERGGGGITTLTLAEVVAQASTARLGRLGQDNYACSLHNTGGPAATGPAFTQPVAAKLCRLLAAHH